MQNRNILHYMVTLLLGVSATLCYTLSLWRNDYVSVRFKSDAARDVQYTVFYAGKGQKFDPSRTVKIPAKAGSHELVAEIHTDNIERVRLDVAPAQASSAGVIVTDFRVIGREIYKVNDYEKDCIYNARQQFRIDRDRLHIEAKPRTDPFFVIRNPLNIKARFSVDWLILSSIVVLSCCFLIKSTTYAIRFKLIGSGRNRDIVFVVLFFCALFLPMMDISEAESSIKENRRLAAKPDLNRLFDQKYQYGTKFEQWFSDRFYGRDWLVSLHSKINWGYSKTGNDRVLLGRDNWLFYKRDKNLEDYMNIHPATTEELQRAAQYVAAIQSYCETHNKIFAYFIAPNKHNVYPEYYRYVSKQNPAESSMIARLSNAFDKAGVEIIYPLSELMDAKKNGFVYHKHGTHWTDLGAYVGYLALMKEINKTGNYPVLKPTFVKGKSTDAGMEPMYPQAEPDTYDGYDILVVPSKIEATPPVGKRRITRHRNPSRKGKVVVLRDSFTIALAPFLDESFGEVYYIWDRQITADDVERYIAPADIVILETVERYAPNLHLCQFPQ